MICRTAIFCPIPQLPCPTATLSQSCPAPQLPCASATPAPRLPCPSAALSLSCPVPQLPCPTAAALIYPLTHTSNQPTSPTQDKYYTTKWVNNTTSKELTKYICICQIPFSAWKVVCGRTSHPCWSTPDVSPLYIWESGLIKNVRLNYSISVDNL